MESYYCLTLCFQSKGGGFPINFNTVRLYLEEPLVANKGTASYDTFGHI